MTMLMYHHVVSRLPMRCAMPNVPCQNVSNAILSYSCLNQKCIEYRGQVRLPSIVAHVGLSYVCVVPRLNSIARIEDAKEKNQAVCRPQRPSSMRLASIKLEVHVFPYHERLRDDLGLRDEEARNLCVCHATVESLREQRTIL